MTSQHTPDWLAINPRAIASECSPAHIENIITDAQRHIVGLTAQRDELLELAMEANNALNSMAAQVDAEWRSQDKAAEKHDAVVRRFREQMRAAIAKARGQS